MSTHFSCKKHTGIPFAYPSHSVGIPFAYPGSPFGYAKGLGRSREGAEWLLPGSWIEALSLCKISCSDDVCRYKTMTAEQGFVEPRHQKRVVFYVFVKYFKYQAFLWKRLGADFG